MEHHQPSKASKALIKLRHKHTSPTAIDAEIAIIERGLEAEKALVHGVAVLDLFRRTNLRRTLLSWGLMTCLGGSGSLMFLVYGTYFFAVAGQTAAFQESIGMTAAGLVCILPKGLVVQIMRLLSCFRLHWSIVLTLGRSPPSSPCG